MDSEQIRLVRLSFANIAGRELEAGRLFYRRLFEIAPETRVLFRNDMDVQSEKIIHMLGIAVGMLSDAKALEIVLESLGRRHRGYGARIEHFEKVGEALIWMLEQMCGDGFTPQVRACWAEVYRQMASSMKRAMLDKQQVA